MLCNAARRQQHAQRVDELLAVSRSRRVSIDIQRDRFFALATFARLSIEFHAEHFIDDSTRDRC